MLTISRRVAVIATSLVLAGGAAVVVASTASASTARHDDGFTMYCTPIRPGDDDAGFYCTPTDDDFRSRRGGRTYGPPQAPRTAPPTTAKPPAVVPTTVAPTTVAPPTTALPKTVPRSSSSSEAQPPPGP